MKIAHKTSSLSTYQQIEYMVENGVCVTIDISYEDSKFIVSAHQTSAFNESFSDEHLPNAIDKAYKYFVNSMIDE